MNKVYEGMVNHRDSIIAEQQKKIDALEKKLAEAVEYNITFLGYALADRYQWNNDFLTEVGRHIKSLEEKESER